MVAVIVIIIVAVIVLVTLARTIRIVPQARAGVVERLGRYSRTLSPGVALCVPFIDRVRPALDPPASIQDSMEKQMRADRDKRASILQAERQSSILQAEGEKQAAILRAEGQRQATMLQAEGQAKAIETVFQAIHDGKPDAELLAYQYLQTLPLIAQGEANKVWIIPSDLQQAVGRVAGAVKDLAAAPPAP